MFNNVSKSGIRCITGNATLVVLAPGHHDVATLTPVLAPARGEGGGVRERRRRKGEGGEGGEGGEEGEGGEKMVKVIQTKK